MFFFTNCDCLDGFAVVNSGFYCSLLEVTDKSRSTTSVAKLLQELEVKRAVSLARLNIPSQSTSAWCIAVRVNHCRSSESPLKFTSVLSAGSGVPTVRQRLSVLSAQCSDGSAHRWDMTDEIYCKMMHDEVAVSNHLCNLSENCSISVEYFPWVSEF